MTVQRRPVTGTAGRLPACALGGWKLLNTAWKGEGREGKLAPGGGAEALRPRASYSGLQGEGNLVGSLDNSA